MDADGVTSSSTCGAQTRDSEHLSVPRAAFERIGKAVPGQMVGGLSIAQAKSLAMADLRD